MNPEEFKILETLDSGSFNQAFLVENINSEKKYVAKIIMRKFSSDNERSLFSFEVQKLLQFQNPSIVPIVGFSPTNFFNENYPTIFSEYIPNRSLRQFLKDDSKSHELSNTGKYINLLGIALGLQYLHSQNLVHYNLKPENILLDDNYYPHISGYGLTKLIKEDFPKNFLKYEIGSLFYMAPEILEKRNFNAKADVYSYSLIAYSIITGKEAIIEGNTFLQIENIIEGKRPNINSINNVELKKFLTKCWSKNPEDRPSFDEIVDILTTEDFYSIFNADLAIVMNYIHLYQHGQKCIQNLSSRIFNFEKKNMFEIVFVGDSKVGKTALFESYLNRTKCIETCSTTGTSNNMVKIETQIGPISLNLCDTAGNDKIMACLSYYLKSAQAVLLFADVSVDESLENLKKWLEIVNKFNILKYLAVTKCDLEWKISKEKLTEFANENNMVLFFTSCDDLNSINEMINKIANDLAIKYNLSPII